MSDSTKRDAVNSEPGTLVRAAVATGCSLLSVGVGFSWANLHHSSGQYALLASIALAVGMIISSVVAARRHEWPPMFRTTVAPFVAMSLTVMVFSVVGWSRNNAFENGIGPWLAVQLVAVGSFAILAVIAHGILLAGHRIHADRTR